MYNKFEDTPLSKPVVTSALSAKNEAEEWIARHHQTTEIIDQDGLAWSVVIAVQELPDAQDPRRADIEVQVSLSADVTAEALVACATLSREEDARLFSLIGSRVVPLRMRPIRRRASRPEEVRAILADTLSSLRKSLGDSELRAIKRELIGRWVDQGRRFGIT